MSILNDTKKREEKEQKAQAEVLIKITDEVMELLKSKDIAVWQVKTIHSLLGNRLTQNLNNFVDKMKLSDIK